MDESPTSVDYYGYMHTIYNKVKTTMTNGNLVWTNPGVPVDMSFYMIADMINAYENTYHAWAHEGGNSTIPLAVRNRSTVMLHSYPSNTNTMASDVDNMVDGPYYGGLIIINSNYNKFDKLWPTFCSEVAQSNSNLKC